MNKYHVGDRVLWRTPGNVSVEQHGFEPNTVVEVTLTVEPSDDAGDGYPQEAYETESSEGWVSVLEDEIVGLA